MILAVTGVGLLLYLLTRQMSHDQPEYGPNQDINNGMTIYDDYMGGPASDYFLAPARHIGSTVNLPVRYPHRTGHELSCIIHEGWSAMSKSAPQDADWMTRPPSEESL